MSYCWNPDEEEKKDRKEEQEEELRKFDQILKNHQIKKGMVRIIDHGTDRRYHRMSLGKWVEDFIPCPQCDQFFKGDDQLALAFNEDGDYRVSQDKGNSICINKIMSEMDREGLEGMFKARYDEDYDILYVDLSEVLRWK